MAVDADGNRIAFVIPSATALALNFCTDQDRPRWLSLALERAGLVLHR
jgi:hypothetical protein